MSDSIVLRRSERTGRVYATLAWTEMGGGYSESDGWFDITDQFDVLADAKQGDYVQKLEQEITAHMDAENRRDWYIEQLIHAGSALAEEAEMFISVCSSDDHDSWRSDLERAIKRWQKVREQ
jgi:hypothetical protein